MSRPHRRTRSPLRWISLAVLLVIALGYVHPLRAYLRARSDVAERRAEVVKLQREKDALRTRLAEAGSDEYVLREARMLGLVRPGEHLYIVKDVTKAGLR